MSVAAPTGARFTAADYYAQSRPSGLFTSLVSQRAGAYLALAARRLRLSPSALSLVNLVVGVATAVGVAVTAVPVADGRLPAWPVGLLAFLLWQFGYAADCADGQLARVTGTSSPAGGRLDVLCDVALQVCLVAAIGQVAVAQRPDTPAWLVGAFAAAWMINMVTSVMAKQGSNASLIASESVPVRLVKLVRDYGAVVTLICAVLAVVPAATVWLLVLFTAVNGLFLLASVAAAARAAFRG